MLERSCPVESELKSPHSRDPGVGQRASENPREVATMILVGGEPVFTGNAGGEREILLWKLLEHPVLVESANTLKEAELQTIKPPQPSGNEDYDLPADGGRAAGLESPTDSKYVYIFQKEFATASPIFAEFIGTDEITTCLGLVVRDPSSGLTSVGHFDTPDCVLNGVNELVNSVLSLSNNTFQVHLVGSFDDSSEYSDQPGAIRPILKSGEEWKKHNARRKPGWSWPLAVRMIETLQNSMHNFELETCFILKHNTTIGPTGHPCPTIRGFVVETSSGRLMPANFEPDARCPDGTVRGVRTTTVSADRQWVATLVSSYDTLSDTFNISPFKWGGDIQRYALYMLTLPDAAFLDTFSSSPHAEGPDFLPTSRRIFNYIKNFPHWEQTFPGKTFSNHKPRVFTRTNTGGWVRKQH